MRTICLDLPPEVHDEGLAFWRTALAADSHRGRNHPEYHSIDHPAAVMAVLVQHLGEGAPRVHLDIDTDDVRAEVARLVSAGAAVVEEHQSPNGDWTVLSDPAGLLFCVVTADVDDAFVAHAVEVG